MKDNQASGLVRTQVRVIFPDGRERVEMHQGITSRHAIWKARDAYRGEARVEPVRTKDF